MSTFDEMGISADLVEALAAEGFERPTALQAAVTPVLRRGTSVLTEAARGAGTLLAYGVPILDRIAAEETKGAIVMVGTPAAAASTARALARVATPLGISVAAVGSVFAQATEATIVVGTPTDIYRAVEDAKLKLDRFDAWVVDGLTSLAATTDAGPIDRITDQLGKDALGVIVDLPIAEAAEALAASRLGRVMHVPPRAADVPKPSGKSLYYRVADEARTDALLSLVAGLRGAGSRVAVLFRTEDQVADIGDELELYGHATGAVLDDEAAVWIGVDDPAQLEGLADTEGPLVVVCHQAPPDRGILDLASRDSHEWITLVTPQEMSHLRQTAMVAGWDLRAAPPSRSIKVKRGLRSVAEQLDSRLGQGGLEPYALLVEELLGERDPAELAAAALALWNERQPDTTDSTQVAAAAPGGRSWSKLFLTIGERDGVRTGDLLGAVTGESGVSSETVGKIDIRESHSIIEVETDVADTIIKAVNGTSIRGRSVRVDYDRPAQKRSAGRPGGRAPRSTDPRR